jgi:hypothetical protein
MIDAKPRNMSEVAKLSFSAERMPRKPPRMTMAILMYNSGRIASRIHPARSGKKLPTISPTMRATTKPPSAVSRSPVSKAYAGLGGVGALIATYIGLLALMTAGAAALRADLGRFILAFTAVFWISYVCWIVGSYAHLAVNTPAAMQKFGISWCPRARSARRNRPSRLGGDNRGVGGPEQGPGGKLRGR